MQLSLSDIREVERLLNEVRFWGAPLGGLCAGFLYGEVYFQPYKSSVTRLVRLTLSRIKSNLEALKTGEAPDKHNTQASIAFNVSANLGKNKGYFINLAHSFRDFEQIIVSREKTPFKITEEHSCTYFTYGNLTAEQNKLWKKEREPVNKKLRPVFDLLKRKYGFPSQLIFNLENEIFHQTRYLIYFKDLFAVLRPMALITDLDRYSVNASIVEATRICGIPTYTLIHGSTSPPDFYYPLIADYMICWGENHKKQFSDLGIAPERLLVCGNQKMERTIAFSRQEIRKKFGYAEEDIIVLLATNVIKEDQRIQYAMDFCEAIFANSAIKGIIKIHPSEAVSDYEMLLSKYPGIRIFDPRTLSAEESFALSDYVVSHNSVYGLEALIKRKTVMIYGPSYVTFPLGVGREMADKAGCKMLNDFNELKIFLGGITHKPSDRMNELAEKFILSYIASFGMDAADNILHEILARARNEKAYSHVN